MKGTMVKGYLCAVVSAIIYGCMPLMAKHIYASGVTPMSLVFLRNAISLVPLAVIAYVQNKTLRIPLKQVPAVAVIAALGCCVTPILIFSAYAFMDSGTATVFHYVYPAVVVVSEILFMKKKARIGNLVSVALCVAGVCMFYSPQQTISLTGSVLAIASGAAFAAYLVMLSHFDRSSVPGFLMVFYTAVTSSLLSLAACILGGQLVFPSTASGWGLCILFSVLISIVACYLLQKSAFLIGSERTSILGTLEPITSVIIGVLVFQEPFGPRAWIGSGLVMMASILIAVCDIKNTADKKA